MSLTRTQNQELSIWDSKEQVQQIKEIYGRNLSAGEFTTLVQMGKATNLNPFLREIWAVKFGDNAAQIFIGRDGYRKSAQSHPLYDYHSVDAVYSNDHFKVVNGEVIHEYSFKDRGILVGAYCLVQRKGSSRPTFIFVEIKEYNKNQSVWKEKPATMIKKVAEAQGLRMAFQELFAGTYHEDEDFTQTKAEASDKPKGVLGLKQKLGINKPTDVIEGEFDEVTGEVEEPKAPINPNPEGYDKDGIKFLMETATTLKELTDAVYKANSLSDSEKKEMQDLFKKLRKELPQ